jgi:hypothetical protein
MHDQIDIGGRKMSRIAIASCSAAALILAVVIAAAPARADMQVIESNVDAHPVGSKLPDGTVFNLRPGQRITVMHLPSYRTQTFEGERIKAPEPAGGTRGIRKREQP